MGDRASGCMGDCVADCILEGDCMRDVTADAS